MQSGLKIEKFTDSIIYYIYYYNYIYLLYILFNFRYMRFNAISAK